MSDTISRLWGARRKIERGERSVWGLTASIDRSYTLSMKQPKTKQEWEDILITCLDCSRGLTNEETIRYDEVIDLLSDAMEAACRGGDFSTPIYSIVEKYGDQE